MRLYFLMVCLFALVMPGVGVSAAGVVEARKTLAELGYPFSPNGFVRAIQNGDKVAFDLYLESGINPNGRADLVAFDCGFIGHYEVTPLFIASFSTNGSEGFVDRLLAKGADVNARNSICSQTGLTALMAAVEHGTIALIQKIASKGADLQLADNKGKSALYYALGTQGSSEKLKVLLALGADPNNGRGAHPVLERAVGLKDVKSVELLFQHKADPDIMDANGYTPLLQALHKGSNEMVALLLKNGASTKLKDYPDYTYHLIDSASFRREGSAILLQALLKKGADIEARDHRGFQTLALAAQSGYDDQVKLLLENGANPNLKTKEGYTPLDYALDQNKTDAALVLTQHGAKKSR